MTESASPVRARSVTDRLLHSAKRLFAIHGFEHTTTAAIARESGTSESQLSKYFQNKEGLLQAIFEDGWRRMGFVFTAASIAPEPEERLRIIFELILRSLEADPELRQLLLFEGRRVRGKGDNILLTDGYFQLVHEVESLAVQVLAKRGSKVSVGPRAIASALIGTMESMLRDQALSRLNSNDVSPTSEEIRTVFALMIRALTQP